MLPYKHNLITLARNLRKNATRHENHLWYDFLRKYPVSFRRQRPIGGFIVDFYCKDAKIIIELDGSQHFEEKGISKDEKRTKTLENLGLTVLRFSNNDIDKEFDGVCAAIDEYVKKAINSDSQHLPPQSADADSSP